MTVSIESTSKKYRGRKAATYESIRKKQERWHVENRFVEKMLIDLHPRSVLDVPVGTGRFFALYRKLGVENVTGVDSSEDMLWLAKRKIAKDRGGPSCLLELGDARELPYHEHDVGVCVRFLDLIDESAMLAVMKELCRLCDAVILTIRFGSKYVPKSNTAEHDEKKFRRLVTRLGFAVSEEHPIFRAGWRVLLLRRNK